MADTMVALSVASVPAEKASFGIATHTAVGAVASGANTATFTAVAKQQWFCTQAEVSFGGSITAACTFTISDGATVIYQAEFGTTTTPLPTVFDFQQRPLHASVNAALQGALTSPGVPKSAITLMGFPVLQP